MFRFNIFSLVVRVVPRFGDYIGRDIFLGTNSFNVKDLIFILIELSFIYLIFFSNLKITKKEKEMLCEYASLLIIAILFSLCGREFYMMHRMTYYFSVFLIVSIPFAIKKVELKRVMEFIVVASMFYMLYRNSIVDNNGISNYTFFWS